MNNKAIIYCRTACLGHNESLADAIKPQLLECIRLAEINDYEVVDVVTEIGSGLVLNKGLVSVLRTVKAKKVNCLITYSVSRIARNYTRYASFVKRLTLCGAILKTVIGDSMKSMQTQEVRKYKTVTVRIIDNQ